MDELTLERYPWRVRDTDTPLTIEARRRVLSEAMRPRKQVSRRETSRETLRSDRTVA